MKLLQCTQRVLALCLCAATLCLAACNSGLDTEFSGGEGFGNTGNSLSSGDGVDSATTAFGISATPSKTYTGSYSGDSGGVAFTENYYLVLYGDSKALFVTEEIFSGESDTQAWYGSYTQSGDDITISNPQYWNGKKVSTSTESITVTVSGNSVTPKFDD